MALRAEGFDFASGGFGLGCQEYLGLGVDPKPLSLNLLLLKVEWGTEHSNYDRGIHGVI